MLTARIDLNNGSFMNMEFQTTDEMMEWVIQHSNPFFVSIATDRMGKMTWHIGFRSKTGIPDFKINDDGSNAEGFDKWEKAFQASNCWHNWTQAWVK